ncbi:hypothetical protein HFN16_00670 [Pseudodesulfovibrio sp. zrk46]|nr:hypothetical protein HFN16_00670 [Pseudodesulfovibrio sp. zrk46]
MLGTIGARTGYGRYDYKVVPGLYCVGNPTPESQVLVTANYKLTFDAVRKELGGQDVWLLIADTRGINVWCAAGKSLFSTEEIVLSVQKAQLDKVVSHRTLILPQLGATGTSATAIRKQSGFTVVYGPVEARDLPAFIAAGNKADETMRTVTFDLVQRAELIPVEVFQFVKPMAIVMLAVFLLSGIGSDFYSMSAAWSRGLTFAGASILAILAGCVAVPLLLPHLPWRHFSAKGALTGGLAGILATSLFNGEGATQAAALLIWNITAASYLAMNFTGSTPYTSPTGVEREMRQSLPWQIGGALVATILWLAAPFI